MADTLLFRVENGVGWIVLNRPEARNAMNAEMRQAYLDALARCAEDAEVRAVVLTGTGKGFCTGADLSGSRAATGAAAPPQPGATRDAMRPSQRVIRALWELEKPIVAGVNGVAAGLGAHLAWACDLVVAADDARFIEVFVRRGIALDAGGGFLLPRHVGLHKAKELVFFGDELSAADAERLGLVNKVVPAAELEAACREGHYARAAEYLNLRHLPQSVRAQRGAELARELETVLERALWVDLDRLSDQPEGDPEDGLLALRDSLGTVETAAGPVEVLIERVSQPGGPPVWKIAASTVAAIPALYDDL